MGGERINQDTFIHICQAVGISDWEKIVDSHDAPNLYEIGIPTPLALPTQPVSLPSEVRVEILYPKQNSIIDRTVEVSAITENISEDLQKWVIVYAPGARKYYPNEIVEKESKWKESIIVGSVDCYGADFKILLFITNIEGSNYLRSFSDGTKQLPPGVSFEVIVYRAYTPPNARPQE